jgi:hypothetical protein
VSYKNRVEQEFQMMTHSRFRSLFFAFSFVALFFCSPSLTNADDKKLTPEELIARHLESIGSKEALAAVKTRAIAGSVRASNRIGSAGEIIGKGVLLSQNPKLVYAMTFPSAQYPSERMAYDGATSATGFLPEGKRSNLSLFLSQQTLPLNEGLLGGSLSTAWSLLRIEQLKPRFDYKGVKKVNDKQMHILNYRQRSGSPDLKVTLYFDAATFRHLKSEYKFTIPARISVGSENSNVLQESYYLLTEEFDDFRAVDGLTLPHTHKMQLSVSTASGTLLMDWLLKVDAISHKEVFDEKSFKLN